MSSETIRSTVGSYCPFVYGKALKSEDRKSGRIPVYGSNGIVGSHDTALVDAPGIIVGRKGSVGELHLSEHPFWAIDTAFYITGYSLNELRFIFYLLKSLGLNQMNSDSAVPGLNRDNAHQKEIEIPRESSDREKIGQYIGNFDDKIAINNCINQTLESIAQALFKSWFIDFEPVKAKILAIKEGTDPQLAAMFAISGLTEEERQQLPNEKYKELAATADLFPDELVESELGMIPKGWKVEALGKVIQIKHGYAFKGEFISTEESDKILLTPGNFKIGGGFKSDKFKYFQSVDFPSDYILNAGNLIVTMTDLSKAGDTLGFPAFVPKYANKVFLHNQRIGKIENNQLKESFLFQLLCQKNYREKILGSATGSTVKHTSPSRIYEFEFVRPLSVLIERYDNIVGSQIDYQIKLEEESKLLGVIRDTLLPKLLSGEILLSN